MSAFVSTNPADGQRFAEYPAHNAKELQQRVTRCAVAQAVQAARSTEQRAGKLLRLAELLETRRSSLALLISREMGKLLSEAEAEVDKSANLCREFARLGPGWLTPELVDMASAGRAEVHYRPIGVVLAVMPWNFPLWQVLRCSVPAWMAGNTVLLKHAPTVTGCALALEALVTEAFGDVGFLTVLLIDHAAVAAVLADSNVRVLHFTGSVAAGRTLASVAAQYGKRAVLELGGSDPFIVLDGADVDAAAAAALDARFRNAGQSCTAAKRFLVVASVYEQFQAAFLKGMTKLRAGNPLERSTTLAPLATREAQLKLKEQLNKSLAAGAVSLFDPANCMKSANEQGFYIGPALLASSHNTVAFREETFGPLAVIVKAENAEIAAKLANDSRYGLGASVWGPEADVTAFSERLQCGVVGLNRLVRSEPILPFGGVKDSGFGWELGRLGLREFAVTQTRILHA